MTGVLTFIKSYWTQILCAVLAALFAYAITANTYKGKIETLKAEQVTALAAQKTALETDFKGKKDVTETADTNWNLEKTSLELRLADALRVRGKTCYRVVDVPAAAGKPDAGAEGRGPVGEGEIVGGDVIQLGYDGEYYRRQVIGLQNWINNIKKYIEGAKR